MNDTARFARQSDREMNPAFRRRWQEPPSRTLPSDRAPARAPALATDDEELAMAALLRWRDEWRARRSARLVRREAVR